MGRLQPNEGLAIPYERQLFLHSTGVTTLANCSPDPDRVRFKSVVLAQLLIARIPGGLPLCSPSSAIRLRRTGDARRARAASLPAFCPASASLC